VAARIAISGGSAMAQVASRQSGGLRQRRRCGGCSRAQKPNRYAVAGTYTLVKVDLWHGKKMIETAE